MLLVHSKPLACGSWACYWMVVAVVFVSDWGAGLGTTVGAVVVTVALDLGAANAAVGTVDAAVQLIVQYLVGVAVRTVAAVVLGAVVLAGMVTLMVAGVVVDASVVAVVEGRDNCGVWPWLWLLRQ